MAPLKVFASPHWQCFVWCLGSLIRTAHWFSRLTPRDESRYPCESLHEPRTWITHLVPDSKNTVHRALPKLHYTSGIWKQSNFVVFSLLTKVKRVGRRIIFSMVARAVKPDIWQWSRQAKQSTRAGSFIISSMVAIWEMQCILICVSEPDN